MKTKLVIISIAVVAVISLGATKLARNERTGVTQAKSTNTPIGGIMADEK